jgi:hypothetical protein
MTYQEEENQHVEQILNGFGIHTRDEDTGLYLSVNEVMVSIGKMLKQIRETNDEKYYQIAKESILLALLGHRYRNEVI